MLNQWINNNYLDPLIFKSKFKSNQPFPNLVLKNFFNQNKLLMVLKELTTEEFHLKDSDLFTFFQTNDFRATKNKFIKEFRDFLNSPEFVNYLSQLTTYVLKPGIECFATIYQDTNYLLPHDDRVEKRKIAYMIYLSNLDRKDGGILNFYSRKNNKPTRISKKIIPQFNTFVFFEVSKKSFHSISEVTAEKQRITITGWFYD